MLLKAAGHKPRAAFLSPRLQFFIILTNPKPASDVFIFFPAVNWFTSGFVYATLSLNWPTCR